MKYIASTPTSPPAEATAYADIIVAQEVIANATTAQASSTGLTYEQHRTQFVISRGNVPNNTTYLQNYQFAYGTSVNPTNWAYFGNYGFDSSVTITGQTPNTTFYVRTRAISTVTNAPGTASSNASVQLNPLVPDAPTLSFSSTSASERANAYLTWSGAGGYATQYDVYRNGSFYAKTSGTSMTVTGHSAGTAYNYRVYAGNRLNEFSYSNIKYMSTGNNVDWDTSDATAKYIQNYGSCSNVNAGNLVITAPISASSSGDAGYYYINTIKFEALKTAGSGNDYSIGDGSRLLYFSTTGTTPTTGGWSAGKHAIGKFPIYSTGTFYEWGVYLGGADISGATFKVTTSLQTGGGWGNYNASCVANTAQSITGRNITLTGYRMTSTTYG
jgi:hypothetical protein